MDQSNQDTAKKVSLEPFNHDLQGYSLKAGGRVGGGGQSNVFAVGATSSTKQDRSYYKSLYHFNADVELAEYSLPVLSNQQQAAKHGGQQQLKQSSSVTQKMPSGIINNT